MRPKAAKTKAERSRDVRSTSDFVMDALDKQMREGKLSPKEFNAAAKQYLAYAQLLAVAGQLEPEDDDAEDDE